MRQRRGFTLIEMMVSVALTLFIMVILSEAFIVAIETFSQLKGLGDMQVNLRTALTTLRDDLGQDHCEGKRRLSDPTITGDPPREGFLVVYQGSPSTSEGNDANGVPSYTATNHALHCAVKRRGNRRESFFSTTITDANFRAYTYLQPGAAASDATLSYDPNVTVFSSQWAEVAYYLVQTGTVTEPNNPAGVGTPLYGLYRAQLVVVPDNSQLSNNSYRPADFAGVACNLTSANTTTGLTFYTPNDLAAGRRTLQPSALVGQNATNAPLRGATLLLPNVLSFHVQVLKAPAATSASNSPNTTYGDLGTTTYDSNSTTNTFGLAAVQITLRVWDPRSAQARQATIVQDL